VRTNDTEAAARQGEWRPERVQVQRKYAPDTPEGLIAFCDWNGQPCSCMADLVADKNLALEEVERLRTTPQGWVRLDDYEKLEKEVERLTDALRQIAYPNHSVRASGQDALNMAQFALDALSWRPE
jgi:hypothetical protein